MNYFDKFNLSECSCKKEHSFSSQIIIEEGAILKLPEIIKQKKIKKAFMISDRNTFIAAGEKVQAVLQNAGIEVVSFSFDNDAPEPDEANVGLAVMKLKHDCDAVIGVGSGVINDISKIVASVSEKFYIIVGTAPSMDGYASATSSMTMEGLKISLPSKCADVIIGDIDILCNAPIKLMVSGLGDMLAKYVSICEWRISNVINGEYYCEKIASIVRNALKICVDNAENLLKREKNAVKAVFEGLVICGAAMKFAGVSRPASGVEHYISHIWDMRGVQFKTPVELHGIQCAIGTLISIRIYEQIKNITPDREKAIKYVEKFDIIEWNKTLREFLGKAAQSIIELEKIECKYDKNAHKKRIDRIIENWDEIIKIINEELPSYDTVKNLLLKIGAPIATEEIGIESSILPLTFKTAKDIRDKYVLPRLCWDLGILDEICF